MGEEGSESTIATSLSTPDWCELHGNPFSSWTNMNPWHPSNPSSNSSCDEDMSISTAFTNASNLSNLTVSSPHEFVESALAMELSEPASENHLWNQVLLSVGSNRDLHSGQDDGENFLSALSSKNLTVEMFEPACDYIKKLNNSWEFTNTTCFNNMEKQLHSHDGSLMEHPRLTTLSNLVGNWSIAPPEPQIDCQITPTACNMSLNFSMDKYSETGISQLKQDSPNSSPINSGYLPSYGLDPKGETRQFDMESSEVPFLRSPIRYHMGPNSSFAGENTCYFRMLDVPWPHTRHFSDISFAGCLNKPLVDCQASNKLPLKGSNSPDSKKNGLVLVSTRGNGKGTGIASEGKKKRSEESSDTPFKKPKHESSTVSSNKMQVPKVKLGERITALQQIVSPFGKTDTASVLLEAIGYIKFLQEQVQLLSNPYMKASVNKDHTPWGGLERKDKSEGKLDLKSKGLCLVPVSCTPQVYRDNSGSDYWTPTYRGCLYR
ncbi:transcription factor bHLH111-like [Tasmannia lanceolata]|uniref:transcription factor bHLH111-like n=1 Tax=Tasmannia lanceolata TaxID=3420 RepID=UPI00406402FA